MTLVVVLLDRGGGCTAPAERKLTMRDDRLEVSVTFDEKRGYVGTAPELRAAVVALSLGGLRRRIAATGQRRRAAHPRPQCQAGARSSEAAGAALITS
jgi:hypothetical protein